MKPKYTAVCISALLLISFSSASQNVGVGNTTPTEKLDVSGNIKADTIKSEALQLSTNAGIGKVLISDDVGNGAWEELSIPEVSDQSNIGYGVWGDCATNGNISAFQPMTDSSPGFDDNFGRSTSISGDYAIVGSPFDDETYPDQGSASIYYHNGTSWEFMQKLTDPDPNDADWFGFSVTISGDFAMIGAMRDDVTFTDQGSVCVFQFNGSTWEFTQRLEDPDGGTGDQLGWSLAMAGNYLIAGSPTDGGTFTEEGSASIFLFNGVTWDFMDKVLNPAPEAYSRFGNSVSVSGVVAFIGSPNRTVAGQLNQGAVYVFGFDGIDWQFTDVIIDEIGATGDLFGASVSVDGDYSIIGSPSDDGAFPHQGSASMYLYDGTQWLLLVTLREQFPSTSNSFGNSVSLSGNYALVGSPRSDGDKGAATLFQRVGLGWAQMQYIQDPGKATYDFFGTKVSIDSVSRRFMISAIEYAMGSGKVVFGMVR